MTTYFTTADSNNLATARSAVRGYFILAVLALIAIELLAQGGWVRAPHELLSLNPNSYSPFFAFAVGSVFVSHALLRSHGEGVVAAAAVGGILFGLYYAIFQPDNLSLVPLLGLIAYHVGIGSVLVLTWQAWRLRGTMAGIEAAFAFQAGALPILFVVLTWPYLEATYALHPLALDALLFHFDGSLGFQPSVSLAQLCLDIPGLTTVFALTYTTLPLFISAVYAQQYQKRQPTTLLTAFVMAGILGSALYYLFPAAGPLHLLGSDFPLSVPDLASVPPVPSKIAPAFLNAMPSLHMTWALLLWLNVAGFSAFSRMLIAVFCVMTALATMALGEHYLIDLVVACPLALLAQTVAAGRGGAIARSIIIMCVMLIAAWLVYLRWDAADFAVMSKMHWVPMFITAVICLRRVRQ